jgi:hypothetical protein
MHWDAVACVEADGELGGEEISDDVARAAQVGWFIDN